MKSRSLIASLLVLLLQMPLLAATLAQGPDGSACCCVGFSCECPADSDCSISTPQPEAEAMVSSQFQLEISEHTDYTDLVEVRALRLEFIPIRETRGRDPTELGLLRNLIDLPPPPFL